MSKRKIAAVVCMVLALVGITFLAAWNVDEQKTVDISGPQSQQIVVGINPYPQEYEALTPINFGIQLYALVIDFERGKITYIGSVNGKYYWIRKKISLGFLQEVKQIKIDNQNLVINCGKDVLDTVALSLLIAFIVGFYVPSRLGLWED